MDFETMIRDAQKNGLSIDDIVKQFTKTVNAVQQEDKKKNARYEFLADLADEFDLAALDGQFTCRDAAILAARVMAEKYPEWTAGDIAEYIEIINVNIEELAALIGKDLNEMFQLLLDKADKLFDTAPKSKSKSDNEKIANFLREIGL